jgi:two-component system, NarL family, nitrate/nitrite response regulator NarL
LQQTKMIEQTKSIRILIADDHAIFRDGLRRLLESEAGLEVVGEAVNGDEVVTLARQLKPDIILLDLAMPARSGLEALRLLSEPPNTTRVILLTALIEREQIVEALQLGARGIVLKESATQILLKSIRHVMEGEIWVGRESVQDLLKLLSDLQEPMSAPRRKEKFGLTPRELEIVSAIVKGSSNKAIAGQFAISEQTVKNHLSSIFDKMGVSNRLELALKAVKYQLAPRA